MKYMQWKRLLLWILITVNFSLGILTFTNKKEVKASSKENEEDISLNKNTKTEKKLTDWHFLFVIFKNTRVYYDDNGVKKLSKVSLSKNEIAQIQNHAAQFEEYFMQTGLICPHVDVIVVKKPITSLSSFDYGQYLSAKEAASLLKNVVDLDQYDHVTAIGNLGFSVNYGGIAPDIFENQTGFAFIPIRESTTLSELSSTWPNVYIHEFLHFMERMNRKWEKNFTDVVDYVLEYGYTADDNWKAATNDTLYNQIKGPNKEKLGIERYVWNYSPIMLRTAKKLNVPEEADIIGEKAFYGNKNLTQVNIPKGVTEIGFAAFGNCSSLKDISFPKKLKTIGDWAFAYCEKLKKVDLSLTNVKRLPYEVFYKCSSLKDIYLTKKLKHIDEFAFEECNHLSNVYFNGSRKQWSRIDVSDNNDILKTVKIHYKN